MLRAFSFTCVLLSISVFAQNPKAAQANAPTKLDADAANLHYDALAAELAQTPPGPEHDLFAGVLADRTSRFTESIRLLTPFASATDLPRTRMALVLGSLADDYVKLFQYAQANALYNRLLTNYAGALSPTLLKDDQDDNEVLKLLLHAAPQTIDLNGTIDLPTHSDRLGSITADLTVNGTTTAWILDTGANFSVVSESFAKQIGLTPSAGIAHTMGGTGVESPLHIGVLDTLHVGTATLHNVVFLIFPDADLTMPTGKKKTYTIPAILGYPVFQSLGIIRFTHNHRFLAGPSLQITGASSPIYMEKLNVLVSCETHNVWRLFQFDSGASNTTFFAPYHREFLSDFAQQKLGTSQSYGTGGGGLLTSHVYLLDDADLKLGGQAADLHHIVVFKTPQQTLSDHYYGNLGRDLIAEFDSTTLDFTTSRIYLGNPVN